MLYSHKGYTSHTGIAPKKEHANNMDVGSKTQLARHLVVFIGI